MPSLLSSAFNLRRDPRILKIPPYLSFICIITGVVWLLLLPLDNYSRRTYISENALLPGQVHTYFGGSDQNVFRAFRKEVDGMVDKPNVEVNDQLDPIFRGIGLKVGRQNFTYQSSGKVYEGQNVYAILQAPRGDATEAIVLVAAWRNINEELNRNGVALALTLSRYFKRWSLWSKDIIFLVTPDSLAGPQAWVDAYHDAHDAARVTSLPLKSGALQGALALDYAHEGRFESVHIVYDGANGQLPNLDLINAVNNIAGGQMGMGTALQKMWRHSNSYRDRLQTMLRGMMNQALGRATGPHSCFIPYHVDAVTLQPFGDGWQDEMALGRLVEGSFRSLNNLLEHLHQSFFFYLLMHRDHFVSIGTYLPSAMILAANFTIMAIFKWVKSGQGESTQAVVKDDRKDKDSPDSQTKVGPTVERELFLPLGLVVASQFMGFLPLYIFNRIPSSIATLAFSIFTIFTCALPYLLSHALSAYHLTAQQYQLLSCFSLLLVGMFLSALATLNFSLAFVVGLLTGPLSFAQPWPAHPLVRVLGSLGLVLLSPTVVVNAVALASGYGVGDILREAAFGWNVWGMYTSVIVWCVWWPAWLVGSVTMLGKPVVGKVKAASEGR